MYIDKFKRIVIKVGSSILIDKKGEAKKKWLQEFGKDIKNLIIKKKTNCDCFFRSYCAGL